MRSSEPLLLCAKEARERLGIGRDAFRDLEKHVKFVTLGRRKMYQWGDLINGLEKLKVEPCTSSSPTNITHRKSRHTRTNIIRGSGSTESLFASAVAQVTQ